MPSHRNHRSGGKRKKYANKWRPPVLEIFYNKHVHSHKFAKLKSIRPNISQFKSDFYVLRKGQSTIFGFFFFFLGGGDYSAYFVFCFTYVNCVAAIILELTHVVQVTVSRVRQDFPILSASALESSLGRGGLLRRGGGGGFRCGGDDEEVAHGCGGAVGLVGVVGLAGGKDLVDGVEKGILPVGVEAAEVIRLQGPDHGAGHVQEVDKLGLHGDGGFVIVREPILVIDWKKRKTRFRYWAKTVSGSQFDSLITVPI